MNNGGGLFYGLTVIKVCVQDTFEKIAVFPRITTLAGKMMALAQTLLLIAAALIAAASGYDLIHENWWYFITEFAVNMIIWTALLKLASVPCYYRR